MKKFKFVPVIAGLLAGAASLSATTVIPPTFDQLVGQAELIFHGTVTKVTSAWVGEGAERHIVSYITFKVKDSLKGAAGDTYTLRTFGGTVDEETMVIGDAPKFAVGDDDIVFVENNGKQVVPLVGLMHGQFHVRKDDSGKEIVTTNEDEPLRDVAELGRGTGASTAPPLTPAAFKAAIQNKLQESAHSLH
jgi:hypothetical protein